MYSVYAGDGDGKGFLQVTSLNPYPLVVVRKEECLTHVAKRLKKNLKKVKANAKALSYVQHRLSDWKADYIASNYSTHSLLYIRPSSNLGILDQGWVSRYERIKLYYRPLVCF